MMDAAWTFEIRGPNGGFYCSSDMSIDQLMKSIRWLCSESPQVRPLVANRMLEAIQECIQKLNGPAEMASNTMTPDELARAIFDKAVEVKLE
jgi:hypothetical protein